MISNELDYLIATMGKRRVFLLLLAVVFLSIADLVGIAVVLPYLKIVMTPEKLNDFGVFSYWYSIYPGLDSSLLLLIISGFLCVLFLLKTTLIIILNRYQFRQLTWLTNYLTSKVMDLALNARYSIFHDLPVSQVAGKAYSNTVHASLYFKAVMDFVNDSLFVMVFMFGLAVLYPWLALSIMMVVLIIGGLIYAGVVKNIAKLGSQQTRVENEKHQLLYFMASGMRDINVMGLGGLFSKRNSLVADKCAEINWRYQFQSSLPRICIELTMLFAFVGGAMFLFSLDREQLDTMAPVIGVLAVASLRLIPSFTKLIGSINVYRFSGQFVHDLIQLLSVLKKEQVQRKEDELIFHNTIELKNISFAYGEKVILQDINMVITKKKSVGIVGASGAGKSTLLDLITGLQPSRSGEFYCDGKPFNPFESLSIQRMTGYVPQKIALLDASIAFNITFKDDYDVDRLEKAINAANLMPVLGSLSNGVDTLVGENGVRLSGGQAQRVGIARAIYHQPDLLVFDEATSALDNMTEKALTNEIKSLGQEMAVVIVAHRLSTVMHCDSIYVMDEGRIVDVGTHQALMQRCELYQRMNQASQLEAVMEKHHKG